MADYEGRDSGEQRMVGVERCDCRHRQVMFIDDAVHYRAFALAADLNIVEQLPVAEHAQLGFSKLRFLAVKIRPHRTLAIAGDGIGHIERHDGDTARLNRIDDARGVLFHIICLHFFLIPLWVQPSQTAKLGARDRLPAPKFLPRR